ncbi:hypothetical protein, partial [Klebsiella pneumoniae]|uniref:hypothetical protein n=1 Tax=Klebsiella pneumoniae TaxID=573 RepID=UPI0019543972
AREPDAIEGVSAARTLGHETTSAEPRIYHPKYASLINLQAAEVACFTGTDVVLLVHLAQSHHPKDWIFSVQA